MANYEFAFSSVRTDSGDDVYFKPTDTDFSGSSAWGTGVIAATEVVDTNGFVATLDEAKGYFVYANGTFNAFTADSSTDEIIDTAHGLLNGETVKFKGIVYPIKTISVASGDLAGNTINCTAHGYTAGMRVRFFGSSLPAPLTQGTDYYVFTAPTADTFTLIGIDITAIGSGTVQRLNLPAGITQSTLYYVRDVTTDRFKVSTTAGGSAVNLTDAGSSTMVYVAPSQRSKAADVFLGTVAVRAIPDMIGEGELDAITDQLDVIQAKTDLIGAGGVISGDTTTGTRQIVRIIRNDSYDGTANAVKSFTVTKNFTGWTGTLTVRHRVSGVSLLSKSITVASSTSLTASLSSSDTAFALLTTDEDFGPHPFDIEMVSGSSKQSAIKGIAIITKDQTTA